MDKQIYNSEAKTFDGYIKHKENIQDKCTVEEEDERKGRNLENEERPIFPATAHPSLPLPPDYHRRLRCRLPLSAPFLSKLVRAFFLCFTVACKTKEQTFLFPFLSLSLTLSVFELYIYRFLGYEKKMYIQIK